MFPSRKSWRFAKRFLAGHSRRRGSPWMSLSAIFLLTCSAPPRPSRTDVTPHGLTRRFEFESLNPSENATAIHRLEERALPLHYFRALFRFAEGVSYNGELWYDLEQHLPSIKLPKLNIYQVHHWIIEPLTFREDFSYAEVVINETKPPKRIWFISHWWGEAMCNFVQCLAKHIDIRRMSVSRTAYWAAWAAIGPSDAAPTGRATAAADALLTARVLAPRQVLLMLGPEGEAFRRSWCVLEMAVATGLGEARKDHQKPRSGTLDLVTMSLGCLRCGEAAK
eukprot:g19660.t1